MSPRLGAARLASVCVAATLLASTVGSTGAIAAAPPRHAGDGKRTVAQVEAYWTQERMERAKPVEVVAGRDGPAPAVGSPTGPSSSTVGYSSFELTDTLSFPNRVQGKVFFTRPGAGNFVCSGTLVDALNRSTMITAGHCVHNGGVWSTNLAFAPGYRNLSGIGNAPYGIWGASGEAAPQPWVDSENLRFDVGAAVLARDASGRSLENLMGARGIAFNQSTSQAFRSHGYPVEPTAKHAFDGTRLWACDSSPPVLDSPTSAPGPSTMGIGCDMSSGASGGGWITGAGSLNGVNSYQYSNQPEMMYGPYFGSTIKALYDFAAAQPPGAPGSQTAGNSVPGMSDASPGAQLRCRKAVRRPKKRGKRKRAAKHACKAKRVQPASSAM